jgi:hypothetical protein
MSVSFPAQPFTHVYIIYDADVLADGTRFIEQMSPAQHMPAGYSGDTHAEHERIAALFTQTEDDSQYEYGYLGKESGDVRYFPYSAIDAEGTLPDDDYEGATGDGQHRKWTAELTRDEWLAFAGAYLIDLDDNGYPERYEETMGSLTEHGHLEAVSVDNREGWEDGSGGQVIGSGMYVSFAYASDPAGGSLRNADPVPIDRNHQDNQEEN